MPPARPYLRGIPLLSPPVAPFPLLLLLPPPPPSPDPFPPPQATQRVSANPPCAGGRPADLNPAVVASAAAAASGSSFYQLLRSKASGSPHQEASMSPTAVFPRTSTGGSSGFGCCSGGWLAPVRSSQRSGGSLRGSLLVRA